MTTTTESYHTTFTNSLIDNSNSAIKDDDPSLIVANVTIDELVESCCNEVLPSSSSSSQLNSSSSVSPTHLVRFVHSQSSLVSQIDETNNNNIQQNPSNLIISSHDISSIKQPPFINVVKRLPSPYSTIKPKTIIESTNSMYNTTNLSNITANNISVNNYNVNIHTTNVQQQQQQQQQQSTLNNNDHLIKKCNSFDEKQTTEIVTQILKNIKEVDEQPTTTNYNIHIDSFNFSSSINEQQSFINKKSRIKKEAKALTRIIVKDELTQQPMSPNFLRTKKSTKNLSNHQIDNAQTLIESIPVPYGWQRRILATDIVVYLSPTNTILDSLDSVRHYIESPTSCKCGLQCPLIIDKVFNFDPTKKSKSWEVVQVLEGTHCRQKSNILEMATLTNCIDSFCETEQKPVKRRKRIHNESTNGNVFVCASNLVGNSNNESVVFVNNTDQLSENGQSMTWTPVQQTNVTPPSKRPRGRPRKSTVTSPIITQLAAKPSNDTYQTQPVPSSILSPPASVSSISQTNFVHRNSTSPSTYHQTSNLRHINDNVLTPPILSSTTTDTNVIARVPSIFDQVKTTTNESTFAVLSGVQNVLLSPNRDSNNNNDKRLHVDSSSSVVSTTGKQVTLNVNALKPDFVRSTSATPKSCLSSSTTTTTTSNQIDVISLMGTTNQTQLTLPKTSTVVTVPSKTHDEYLSIKSTNEQINESSQPLMIDFNDPSTTNFLLSALASGASSDSNAIVNHLFQKAQTQQQQPITPSTTINSPTISIKKNLPIISSGGLKNCTETTNLLPSTTSMRQSVVFHVPSTNDYNQQTQQIIFNNDDKKQHQQIFFINNKPYIIQQKITHDQSSQQRLILTPSIAPSNDTSHSNRNIVPVNNNSNTCVQSTLDDGGNCLLLNGPVEPKTLRTLLKGLNSSSFSGVDNLIDTINRFEHTTPIIEQNDNLLIKSIRTTAKKSTDNKPPTKRRAAKKIKQDEQQQQPQQQIQISMPQPIIVEQQHQWQTDFNTFDFSTSWGSDTNLNSLLLNDDFDTAASFDDVNFGDFEPYMNGNNNDITLPSLFVKPLPPDSLPNLDHLLP
ncbi:unnamed protein product [Rotaria sp. Silwood2]|nr:unnamed protein product [Rotaria sp. Silwood2]CAF4104688.1 unnamed protein product [Rotaria sp. Silwood2]